MAKYRDVYKTEKYMDDAMDSVLSNIAKGLKRRKHLSIWDPIETEPSIETEEYDSGLSERNKILTKILSNDNETSFAQNTKRSREGIDEFTSGTIVKRNIDDRRPPKSFYSYELRSNLMSNEEYSKLENSDFDIQNSRANLRASESKPPREQINNGIEQDHTINDSSIAANSELDVQNSGLETLRRTLSSCPLREKGNPLNEKNDKILLNNNPISDTNIDVESMESETSDVVTNQADPKGDFLAWCNKRHEQFTNSSSKNQLPQHVNKAITFMPKVRKENTAAKSKSEVDISGAISRKSYATKYSKSKSEVDISDLENKKSHKTKEYSISRSEVYISDVENKKSHRTKEYYPKSRSEVNVSEVENKNLNRAKCMKSRSEDNLAKTQAQIKLVNETFDKSYEVVVGFSDLSRIKKRFPKLKDILPDIDTAPTTVPYCLEAVNTILRYLFIGRSNLTDLPNAAIAVEVLAATKRWELHNFYSIFYDIFTQKILPSSNIKIIFPQAFHYNLDDVCRACQEIKENSASLSSTYKKKQKTCSISITTYIEPLEFCIPLNFTERNNFELSFERHILNTIRFQVLLGSFTIVGIHINLNNDHLESGGNNSMLLIDYNAKNVTQELELGTGRFEKPLRPINVIYFKNPLEVNTNQIVEITVETDLKPSLCSTYPEEIHIKKRKKSGEFRLNVLSNFKIPKSNENVFIVGKLLYYVRSNQGFK